MTLATRIEISFFLYILHLSSPFFLPWEICIIMLMMISYYRFFKAFKIAFCSKYSNFEIILSNLILEAVVSKFLSFSTFYIFLPPLRDLHYNATISYYRFLKVFKIPFCSKYSNFEIILSNLTLASVVSKFLSSFFFPLLYLLQ